MNKALYFMPDISGFTGFVNDTEIEHSIHIIAELLELLIDAADNDMELVEIEGDALFFYSDKIPTYQDLMEKVNKMMVAFHTHTKTYNNMRICDCGSCRTTTHLQLKFVVHYGELMFIKVKNFIKPYGRAVIKTHRLLKNDIPLKEYLLITEDVMQLYHGNAASDWQTKTEQYDFGDIRYLYKSLEHIAPSITVIPKEDFKDVKDADVIIHKLMHADADRIYKVLSDLSYRHLWDKDAKRIEYDSNKINRSGFEHNCVLNTGSLKLQTLGERKPDTYVFGERTTDMMFTKEFMYLINLDKVDEKTTSLTLSFFITWTKIGHMMKNTMLTKVKKIWNQKLETIEELLSTDTLLH
jgi:hypothetical protein